MTKILETTVVVDETSLRSPSQISYSDELDSKIQVVKVEAKGWTPFQQGTAKFAGSISLHFSIPKNSLVPALGERLRIVISKE